MCSGILRSAANLDYLDFLIARHAQGGSLEFCGTSIQMNPGRARTLAQPVLRDTIAWEQGGEGHRALWENTAIERGRRN